MGHGGGLRLLVVVVVVAVSMAATAVAAGEEGVGGGSYRSEMRSALSTIAAIVRAVADKLERHEVRERQLGEQLRRGQAALEKRLRAGEAAHDALLQQLQQLQQQQQQMQEQQQQQQQQQQMQQVPECPPPPSPPPPPPSAEEIASAVSTRLEPSLSEAIASAVSSQLSGLAPLVQAGADAALDGRRALEHGLLRVERGAAAAAEALPAALQRALREALPPLLGNASQALLDAQRAQLQRLGEDIEAEISQVWRQIGIMYQQLTASASALARLQAQTDAYVNGSAASLDALEGKVGAVRERMAELDDSLNYLLGKLSLFGAEFGQVRSGLGEALTAIRAAFLEAHEAVRAAAPAPAPAPASADVHVPPE